MEGGDSNPDEPGEIAKDALRFSCGECNRVLKKGRGQMQKAWFPAPQRDNECWTGTQLGTEARYLLWGDHLRPEKLGGGALACFVVDISIIERGMIGDKGAGSGVAFRIILQGVRGRGRGKNWPRNGHLLLEVGITPANHPKKGRQRSHGSKKGTSK